MTSADRLNQVLDKWLTSLELHTQYAQLSDLAYSCVQPWPKHDRPTRWVVQIAREKLLQLKQHCDTRRAAGDEQFAESLELMLTLANLVGLQHIQRFIPLADPARANPIPREQPANTPDFAALVRAADEGAESEPTRELPQLEASAKRIKPAAARPARPAIQRGLNAPAMHAGSGARPAASKLSLASSRADVTNTHGHAPTAAADAVNAVAPAAQATTRPIAAGVLRQSTTAAATPIQTVDGNAAADASRLRAAANIGTKPPAAKPPRSAGLSMARVKPSIDPATTPADTGNTLSDTQEMPRPLRSPLPPGRNPARHAAAATAPAAEAQALTPAEQIVITDAIRLIKWGRPWHELAELVSRIADRPGITQVRRILRTHRADIEARAGAE